MRGLNAPLEDRDRAVIAAVQGGLPLSARPFADVGARIGMDEAEVIERIGRLRERGIIKRFGMVVRHHELGYRANAMVVWDVADAEVGRVARRIARDRAVTLCYQRPRRPPEWPYNLFSMIHGCSREAVRGELGRIIEACALEGVRHAVLFSGRRFKQCGARYVAGV